MKHSHEGQSDNTDIVECTNAFCEESKQRAVLLEGYPPAVRRRAEELEWQAHQDGTTIIRLIYGMTMAKIGGELWDLRRSSKFSLFGTRFCVVVNLNLLTAKTEHEIVALLDSAEHAVEFIILNPHPGDASEAIRSRCHVESFSIPNYANVLADTEADGLSLAVAAEVARGVEEPLAPDEGAREMAKGLLMHAQAGDVQAAMRQARAFDPKALQALRELLVRRDVNLATHLAGAGFRTDPILAAVFVAAAILGRRFGESA